MSGFIMKVLAGRAFVICTFLLYMVGGGFTFTEICNTKA
jgi:hypothetical protein